MTWFVGRSPSLTPDDAVRIRHMIEAAQTAQRFLEGRRREDLGADEMLRFAVVQGLQIVGQAASKVYTETRSATPSVPWARVIGMRNRVHAYADINREVVWRTVTVEIPPLPASLIVLPLAD